VMQTTAPVDVVTSCSMLPQLQRGDVVLLHGIPNMPEFLMEGNVPIVNVSAAAYNSMLKNMQNEFLAYYPYVNNNPADILPDGVIPHNAAYAVGLYNTKCILEYSYDNQPYDYGRCMVQNATQQSNLIRYSYTTGNAVINGQTYGIVYTTAIQIANVSINESYSNPIVIYRTNSEDTFTGDIIHRVVAAINASGTYYLLTKGDNNQGLDMQFANYPPSQSDIVGYKVARVPYLGYLKLIISGQITEPAGCNQTVVH
jgi:signal peptidase I